MWTLKRGVDTMTGGEHKLPVLKILFAVGVGDLGRGCLGVVWGLKLELISRLDMESKRKTIPKEKIVSLYRDCGEGKNK